ncbi:hypothetical protein PsorP6_004428 [Peronosclerospora sorghi]|uniref:Uncharacterized protein n=1 Tax=Peronosclerospora sorghi TaxID=230839 RepID=A0ACC0VNY5_9STRA|nr:hypothetical protein PsorP6_004428 [Peronosclerospora sorghi]
MQDETQHLQFPLLIHETIRNLHSLENNQYDEVASKRKEESAYLAAFSEEIVVTAHVLGEDSDGYMRAIFGHIGLEYQHLRNRDAELWIRERLEKYKVESKGL